MAKKQLCQLQGGEEKVEGAMSVATRTLKYGGLATLPLPEPKGNTHGSEEVDPNDLLQFLLPSGFFHSKSTARLYIFAECGPTLVKVRDGWMSLRAGYKGMHVVTEQELEDMITEMIREDILRVYMGDAVLSPTEQEEVISQADPALKSIPNYTKEEFEELLAPALNERGLYDFHRLQALIRKERKDKLLVRKQMYPSVVNKKARLPKGAFQFYDETLAQSIRPVKSIDTEIFMKTAKALSRNSFKIAEAEDKNSPGLVVNARFLREDTGHNPAIPKFKVPVIANTGTRVKSHLPWSTGRDYSKFRGAAEKQLASTREFNRRMPH